jgi:DNA polymerase-3 subunit delta'
VLPGLEQIRDPAAAQRLAALLKKGTLPHAMLFTGLAGVGKEDAALILAMACNCRRPGSDPEREPLAPCGTCPACRKIRSGVHPDIVRIRPSGPFIRIAAIRDLVQTASMKPYEARYRVAILTDAQQMNPEAGNALLKLLEEPPEQTLILLTALQPSDLLPTIVSRCQHIRFRPIARDRLASILAEEHGIEQGRAAVLAAAAGGSLDRALAMGRNRWEEQRNGWIGAFEDLLAAPVSGKLAFSEMLAADRSNLDETLALLKTWVRDLAVYRYRPHLVVNRDLADRIRRGERRYSAAQLVGFLAALERAQRRISANANPRLALEAMTLELTDA